MKRMVAFCGITCTDCKAFTATHENDDAKRKQVADEWKMKPEEVNCIGCTNPNGLHIDYWKTCPIKNCGTEKGVENCASCVDYSCEKLEKTSPKAKETLENLREAASEKK